MRPHRRRLLSLAIAITAGSLARADVCDGISAASDTPLTAVLYQAGTVRPILVTSPPDDVARVMIVEQNGRIRLVKNGVMQGTAFLDVSAITLSPEDFAGEEEGLLGVAFHPDYATNGRFFIYHTTLDGNNTLAGYERSIANPDVADAATRTVLIDFPHHFDNHNGGMIAFGPDDGYLYIGTGDGGGHCDPEGNSQSLYSLQAKMLRIDVDGGVPYAIPPDNPYAGHPSYRHEIWALGLRNPWRWSFDRLNSDLYIGDVGQAIWEEMNYRPGTSPGGENYGWALHEGDHCDNPSCATQGNCNPPGYVPPLVEYNRDGTGECAVTGGYVYRGCRMPALRGTYFYADYCAAWIHSFRVIGGVVTDPQDRTGELGGGGASIFAISSFGEDARGEMYVTDLGGNAVFKIVPILANLEVSGPGATPFTTSPAAWSWEDLELTSSHPIVSYRVYRRPGSTGPFTCIHQRASTSWPGGDPTVPAPGQFFSYVVVAIDTSGTMSSPGTGTGGTPRVLSTAPCPP